LAAHSIPRTLRGLTDRICTWSRLSRRKGIKTYRRAKAAAPRSKRYPKVVVIAMAERVYASIWTRPPRWFVQEDLGFDPDVTSTLLVLQVAALNFVKELVLYAWSSALSVSIDYEEQQGSITMIGG
jgi:hypothetical protein